MGDDRGGLKKKKHVIFFFLIEQIFFHRDIYFSLLKMWCLSLNS